jgi:hypothetical protein
LKIQNLSSDDISLLQRQIHPINQIAYFREFAHKVQFDLSKIGNNKICMGTKIKLMLLKGLFEEYE